MTSAVESASLARVRHLLELGADEIAIALHEITRGIPELLHMPDLVRAVTGRMGPSIADAFIDALGQGLRFRDQILKGRHSFGNRCAHFNSFHLVDDLLECAYEGKVVLRGETVDADKLLRRLFSTAMKSGELSHMGPLQMLEALHPISAPRAGLSKLALKHMRDTPEFHEALAANGLAVLEIRPVLMNEAMAAAQSEQSASGPTLRDQAPDTQGLPKPPKRTARSL